MNKAIGPRKGARMSRPKRDATRSTVRFINLGHSLDGRSTPSPDERSSPNERLWKRVGIFAVISSRPSQGFRSARPVPASTSHAELAYPVELTSGGQPDYRQ